MDGRRLLRKGGVTGKARGKSARQDGKESGLFRVAGQRAGAAE
jgi:hypothetical protein